MLRIFEIGDVVVNLDGGGVHGVVDGVAGHLFQFECEVDRFRNGVPEPVQVQFGVALVQEFPTL